MATGCEALFLDTNVLLSATDPARERHRHALQAIDGQPGSGLFVSGQILREYLVVATRPREANGLGLSQVDAVANALAFRRRFSLLEENARVADRLLDLLRSRSCTGARIHDAQVAATLLAHGVDDLLTDNAGDFQPFADAIRVHPLASIPLGAGGKG